jgi:APA family basic amino acid/polyamine antiporter
MSPRGGAAADVAHAAEDPRFRPLLRVLGVFTGVAVAVSGTIGSGIFRTPGIVASQLGDPVAILVLWVAGTLVFLCGALTYGELGSRRPESGGLFPYIRLAYGPGPGFVYGWLFALIIGPAPAATLAVVFGEYGERLGLAPDVSLRLPGLGLVAPEPGKVLAGGAVLLFTAIILAGVRWGARVQNALVVAKVLGLLALVGAAFLREPAPGAGATFGGAARFELGLLAAAALAFQSVIWAFDGFSDPLKVGEEIRDPGRNVPRALVGGVLVIGGVYLLVNAAILWALPLAETARSNLPAAEAALRLFGDRGDEMVAALAIVSVLGTLQTSLLANPRISYSMARAGLHFAAFRRVSEGGTPVVATLFNSALAFGIALSGTFDQLLALVAFALALGEVAAAGSLFVFRRRHPDVTPAFRVPLYPAVPVVFLAVHAAVIVSMLLLRPGEAAVGSVVVAVAAVTYLIWRRAAPSAVAAGTGP